MKRKTQDKPVAIEPNLTAFEQSRLQHAEENTSDYLEIIADLIDEKGEARLVDLAERLGVSKATANRKVATLQRDGLVKSEPYRSIFLEPRGRQIAEESKARHITVLEFLLAIGVSPQVAEFDSEGIEHHVSKETLNIFEKITAKIKANSIALNEE